MPHYPSIKPELVELTSALHGVAYDRAVRASYISNPVAYADRYKLKPAQRAALIALDLPAIIAMVSILWFRSWQICKFSGSADRAGDVIAAAPRYSATPSAVTARPRRGQRHAARHSSGFTPLTTAGQSVHAPLRAGVEETRAGAQPRHSDRELRRRSRDPVQKGQGRRGLCPDCARSWEDRDHNGVASRVGTAKVSSRISLSRIFSRPPAGSSRSR